MVHRQHSLSSSKNITEFKITKRKRHLLTLTCLCFLLIHEKCAILLYFYKSLVCILHVIVPDFGIIIS